MKVELFDYTGKGTPDPELYAARKLIFTKMTRLEQDSELRSAIEMMSKEQIYHELGYISRTIPGSWEFITYDISIQGVTRAFTHQLVRTRTASFAQQSMRVTDQSDFPYLTGPSVEEDSFYHKVMSNIKFGYNKCLEEGAEKEDARGLLPTNILTNICMHVNLRTVSQMIRTRSSPRVQGEYREFVKELAIVIMNAHPWAEMFLGGIGDAVGELQSILSENIDNEEDLTSIWKLIDRIKS